MSVLSLARSLMHSAPSGLPTMVISSSHREVYQATRERSRGHRASSTRICCFVVDMSYPGLYDKP